MLSVLAFAVVSCTDGDKANDTPANVDDAVIYSQYVDAAIVLGKGVEKSDVDAIRNAYYRSVGKEISIKTAESAPATHEIIVGKTEREISVKAYRNLELYNKEDMVGYSIYSDGKSIAIAFSEASFGENVAFSEAVDCFVTKYMKDSALKLDLGIVCLDSFHPIEKQKKIDDADLNRIWDLKYSQILAKMHDEERTAEIIKELQALRNLYNYDYNIVEWLANLYDPETGGFYYSNSARNNEGYLPDLESTYQALSLVEAVLTGYGGTLTDYFGEDIAGKFVSFAKNMQAENGYFYHPQWSRDAIDKNLTRRTRDLLDALNILDSFGASPVYDTPNGVKGEGVVTPAQSLTTPLSESRVASVSRVAAVSGSEIYIPNYLKSEDAFTSYLSGLNIRENTTTVCETLYSEISLYKSIDERLEEEGASYRLCDILESYLTRNQSASGLWTSAKKITYSEVAKLGGVVRLYNAIGVLIPRYSTVLGTVLAESLSFEEEVEQITDISDTWTTVAAVINNITSFADEDESYMSEREISYFYYNIVAVLKTTREKLLLFLRDDGSFSTNVTGSAYESYGMPVAVPLANEGDINGTILAVKNTYLSVFGVLDIGSVPIFNTSDRMTFQKTLLDMGIIIKNEVKKTAPIDFEEAEPGSSGDVKYTPASSESYAKVVAVPESKGNALNLYSPLSKGKVFDIFHFSVTTSVKNASCYAFELDMCVLPETSSGIFAQLYFYSDTYLIALNRVGNTVRLIEKTGRGVSDGNTEDCGVSAVVGEWFKLRVEYYRGTSQTVRAKIYFNEKCIAVSDNYYMKHDSTYSPATNYSTFAIYGYPQLTTDMLVDNIVTETSYKTYTAETSDTLNRNVDTPDKPQKVHDFESSNLGAVPGGFSAENSSAVTVAKDSNGNNVLSVSEGAGKLLVPLDQRGAGINAALLEFDVTVDSQSEAGTKYQINFSEYFYNARTLAAMQLLVVEEGGEKYLTIAEVSSGKTGNVYSSVKLSLDTKYNISFRLFFEECALVTVIDGEVVGISTSVSDCKKAYMGEVSIEAKTSGNKSTVYIDNLISERIRSSFEEVTAPSIDRVINSFDTADGLELSGVSPEGGVLSFEDVGNKWVKIPVNVRSNVPTMALVSMDISKKSNSGELILYFSDSSDNNIAAFALVCDSSYVSLYEYTKNGRYKTPIYKTEKSDFTLSVEYSPAQENFNLLVDGVYAAASSLIWTEGSGAYGFEYLKVGAYSRAGFTIDNLYAEKICGVFKENSLSVSNPDSDSEIITFENSSFASMPTKIERIKGDNTAYFKIRESNVYGAVSKVLEMHCGTGVGATYSIFSRTKSVEGANAVFFETDLMIKTTDGAAMAMLELQESALAYILTFEVAGPGETVMALGGNGKDYKIALDVKEGEWFHVRLEYRDTPHDFDYDGKNDIVARVYINGELIGESHKAYDINNISQSKNVKKIRVRNTTQRAGIFYLDNSVLGQFNMTYEEPIPADTDTITYEPGVITNKTVFTVEKNTSTAKISEMTVKDQVTKVLELHTSSGSLDKLAVTPTLTNADANAVMFETDIMINPTSGTSIFYLEPQTSANKQPFRLEIKAAKDEKVTISGADIPETVIGVSGEWIHIRVEYMNPRVDYTGDGRYDILYKVYIGDGEAPVATGHRLYQIGAGYDPLVISKFVLTCTSEAAADIFLDNTRVWQIECVADEAPEFPSTGDVSIGGTVTDGGGWT